MSAERALLRRVKVLEVVYFLELAKFNLLEHSNE